MIKILKWVYNKGRQYERMRLKRMAVEFIQSAQYDQQNYDLQRMMNPNFERENRGDGLKKAHHKEHQIEINTAVTRVLQRMIYPDPNHTVHYEKQPLAAIDEKDI